MSLSARNQLSVEISEVRIGAVNSLIAGKLAGGEVLKATITVDSEKALDLKVGKKAIFLFKASSVIVSKDDSIKLSATNQSVHNLALKAGDKVTAIIKATQIIVGVK